MGSQVSNTEYEIMKYFWETGDEFSFAELMAYFNEKEDRDWKKQTLNTFLKRLMQKGLLKCRKEGRKAYYTSQMTESEYEKRCAKEILDENYGGKLTNFIAALSGSMNISEEEEEELLEYIRRK